MQQTVSTRKEPSEHAVNIFAQQALKVLARAARNREANQSWAPFPPENHIQKLLDAVLDLDPRHSLDVIADLVQDGVSSEDIVDVYIPEISKRLGFQWEEDTLAFASVTIGTARIQGLLHRLDSELNATGNHVRSDVPRILVYVQKGCQHTLGSRVVASQLRRRGFIVRLALDVSDEELIGILQKRPFDALFVSATLRESLETLRLMITKAKAVQAGLPIVVGGNILNQNEDIGVLTGADCVTNNIEEALGFCGLSVPALRLVQQSNSF